MNLKENKIDVLFINPRDLTVPQPYLRLCSYAAVIKEANLKCELIEPGASGKSIADILRIIENKEPKIICVAALPSTLPDAYKTIQQIKMRFTDKCIILEGYHVNADPSIVEHMEIEYGIRGDGEYSFEKFCNCIIRGERPPEDLPGLVFIKNNKLTVNEIAVIRDINKLPIPLYELLPIGKYYSASTTKKFMTLVTTRGCPYDCNFCSSSPQMNYRWLNTENSVKQLTLLVNNLGTEWIEFMDLTFTMSKQRTLDLCDAIIKRGLVFDWGCETRADKLDEELLIKMKQAGCKKITFGVESGVERIRRESGKHISNEKMKQIFDLCERNGIKTMANFIFGHPGETLSEMKETIRFAHELNAFNVLFTKMLPLPDVEIYRAGVEKGETNSDIWIKYMKEEIDFPVYYPASIKPAQMERIYSWAYLSFYLSPRQVKKYLPMMTSLKFLVNSLGVFLRLTFGKTAYK